MPRHPCSRRILVREGRAEPATSVRGATHIQVVSRATRDQADPLAVGQQRDPLAPPAGRRRQFLFSGWGRNDRSTAAGRALRGTGYRQTGGIERSALSCPVILVRAESSCARGAPSQRRRSAERPTFRWSAERPAIRPTRSLAPPAGRRRQFLFSGWGRTIDLPPPAAR